MPKSFKVKVSGTGTFRTIYSSPHSGSNYSEEFLAQSNLNLIELRSSEDAFIGELFEIATTYGSAFIEATFPRSFIDLNRSHLELDPKLFQGDFEYESTPRNFAGFGVIPRLSGKGNSIYNSFLSLDEAQKRLKKFYYPYHDNLKKLVHKAQLTSGFAIIFDCHSMPSSFPFFQGSNYREHTSDIVLGDLNGASCDPWLTRKVKAIFESQGFSVVINKPFAGGFITKNYGNPKKSIHAIQIEINRGLYMDEEKIKPNNNFKAFKSTLAGIILKLSSIGQVKDFFEVAAE